LGEEPDDWEEFFRRVAEELADKIRREHYLPYVNTLRGLKTPADKLIYLFLALFQPQTFMTIKRALGLHPNTMNRALNRLEEGDHIMQDDEYFWWVKTSHKPPFG
jgi:DNA-binding MarR family transcriptional regulator